MGCSWTDTLVCSSQWSCVFALGSIPSWFVCAGICWGAIQYEQEGQKLDYIYYMIKGKSWSRWRSWWPLVWPEVFLFKYEKEGTAWLLIKSWGDGRKELLSLPLFICLFMLEAPCDWVITRLSPPGRSQSLSQTVSVSLGNARPVEALCYCQETFCTFDI